MTMDSGVWWCITCQRRAYADEVTREKRHELKGIGCGESVEWIPTEDWNRLATLAEQAGVDSELLWRPSDTCPQGHTNIDDEGEWGDDIGEVCSACLDDYFGPDMIYYLDDQTWRQNWRITHPEWLLTKAPRDMWDPGILIPIVGAYCKITGYGWNLHQYFDPFDGIEACLYAGPVRQWRGQAPHGLPMEALAQALLKALEAGEE